MDRHSFTRSEITAVETQEAVGIANEHFKAAEEILWTVATQSNSVDASEFEALTHDIWEIQHKLADLQRGFE